MSCPACPFACTEESEYAQNLGCLPSPYEIRQIKLKTGKNWACHDDETRICAGYVEMARETGLDYRNGGLASYTRWYHGGEL